MRRLRPELGRNSLMSGVGTDGPGPSCRDGLDHDPIGSLLLDVWWFDKSNLPDNKLIVSKVGAGVPILPCFSAMF